MQILINGYYGCRNLGDDYILYSIIDSLSKVRGIENTEICVFSLGDNLDNVFRLFPKLNLKTITFDKNKRFVSMLLEQKKGLLFLLGGGGLFPEDNYKVYLLWTISFGIIKYWKKGRNVIYGIDICNIKKRISAFIWRMIASTTVQIFTRNLYSAQLLEERCKIKNAASYADVTFGLTTSYEHDPKLLEAIEKQYGINNRKYLIWVFAMPFNDAELATDHFKNRYQKLVLQFAQLVKKYSQYGYYHLFIPFFHLRDSIMIQDISKEINNDFYVVEEDSVPLEAKRALFVHASSVISMRFHGVAFALRNGVPVAALSYAQKTSEIMKECGLMQYCIEYGVRESCGFKKEFDFDMNELEKVADNAVLHADREAFENASKALIKEAKQAESQLIAIVEQQLDITNHRQETGK